MAKCTRSWILEFKNNDYDGPFRGVAGNGDASPWHSERHELDLYMLTRGFSIYPSSQRDHDVYNQKVRVRLYKEKPDWLMEYRTPEGGREIVRGRSLIKSRNYSSDWYEDRCRLAAVMASLNYKQEPVAIRSFDHYRRKVDDKSTWD